MNDEISRGRASFPRKRRGVQGICHGYKSESTMTIVQLRDAMAGLDQVRPAHDELQLVPIKTQQPIPVPRTALRESGNLEPQDSTGSPGPRLRVAFAGVTSNTLISARHFRSKTKRAGGAKAADGPQPKRELLLQIC